MEYIYAPYCNGKFCKTYPLPFAYLLPDNFRVLRQAYETLALARNGAKKDASPCTAASFVNKAMRFLMNSLDTADQIIIKEMLHNRAGYGINTSTDIRDLEFFVIGLTPMERCSLAGSFVSGENTEIRLWKSRETEILYNNAPISPRLSALLLFLFESRAYDRDKPLFSRGYGLQCGGNCSLIDFSMSDCRNIDSFASLPRWNTFSDEYYFYSAWNELVDVVSTEMGSLRELSLSLNFDFLGYIVLKFLDIVYTIQTKKKIPVRPQRINISSELIGRGRSGSLLKKVADNLLNFVVDPSHYHEISARDTDFINWLIGDFTCFFLPEYGNSNIIGKLAEFWPRLIETVKTHMPNAEFDVSPVVLRNALSFFDTSLCDEYFKVLERVIGTLPVKIRAGVVEKVKKDLSEDGKKKVDALVYRLRNLRATAPRKAAAERKK